MDQYLGEIRLCAFPFPPKGWAMCNGALLPIQQNSALFSLLGIQYGGNGTTNFALPDLRGRTPLHRDNQTYLQGEVGGVETVTLTSQQLPMHIHSFVASTAPATASNAGTAQDHLLATSNLYNATNPSISGPGTLLYSAPGTLTAMSAEACGSAGSTQPHENMQPSLVLNYIISLTGIYPSRG
ncbi:phage tail protein [Ralstonia sp. 22086]|uniref:phage tail protein n=1 Tax=Ralstonia TaxID=48736 RepID=UPI003D956E9C